MDKPDTQFIPEQVDEQIARLQRSQPTALPTAGFIQELACHYQEERQTLDGAWQRLSLALDERSESPQLGALQQARSQPGLLDAENSRQLPSPAHKPFRLNWLATVAAALLVIMLISAFAFTFSLLNRTRTGTKPNATPSTSPVSSNAVKTGFALTEGQRLHMVTANVGWAIGSSKNGSRGASILHTTDGGIHWQPVTPSQVASQAISYLYILDETTAWVPGPAQNGLWYRTTDGGNTWKPMHWRGNQIMPFSFSDQNHGWMIDQVPPNQPTGLLTPTPPSKNLLYMTSDGGNSWKQTDTLPFPDVRDFSFITEQTGWLTAETIPSDSTSDTSVQLYVTHNAGRTWKQIPLPRPTDSTKSLPTLTFGPTFTTAEDGSLFATFGRDTSSGMYIYITHDGGLSWQIQGGIVPGYLGVDSVVDSQHILVDSGRNQMDLMTLVNGQWRQLSTRPTPSDPVEESFPSASAGVALVRTQSNSLDVYRSTDGGKTWQKIATLPTFP